MFVNYTLYRKHNFLRWLILLHWVDEMKCPDVRFHDPEFSSPLLKYSFKKGRSLDFTAGMSWRAELKAFELAGHTAAVGDADAYRQSLEESNNGQDDLTSLKKLWTGTLTYWKSSLNQDKTRAVMSSATIKKVIYNSNVQNVNVKPSV